MRIAVYTGMTGDSVTDAMKTCYSYNHLGKLLTKTDPLGQTESYVYDRTGRLLSKTDRSKTKTTYTYNALGQTTNVVNTSEHSVIEQTSAYTKTGQKLSVTEKTTQNNESKILSISYRYDSMGRPIR